VNTKDRGTTVRAHELVNPWLKPYKLTGWLAWQYLREPCTRRILNHRTASPHALYDVLVLDRGRDWLFFVDRDCELPANSTKVMTETWPTYQSWWNFWYVIIILSGKQAQQVTQQIGYRSVTGWYPQCWCSYCHHTFMSHKYHVKHCEVSLFVCLLE